MAGYATAIINVRRHGERPHSCLAVAADVNLTLPVWPSYETAPALRRMTLLQPYLLKYLLASEVAVLLHYLLTSGSAPAGQGTVIGR